MTRTKPKKGGGKSSEENAPGVGTASEGGTGGSSASSPALPPVLALALVYQTSDIHIGRPIYISDVQYIYRTSDIYTGRPI